MRNTVNIKKRISKCYWGLIDWDATINPFVEHDEDGYWIILKQDILGRYAEHNIHEPLADINFYLRQIKKAVDTDGECYRW